MGRYYYSKRTTIDECKSLSIKFLKQHKFLESGYLYGTVTWSRNGNPTGNISISTSIGQNSTIRLWYKRTNRYTDQEKDLDYSLDLVSTPCNYGGERWWFICWHCNRKCSALYLDESDIFLCRKCNNLAYESQNKNRRGVWYPLGRILDFETREKLPQARDKYKYYKGKPTKNMMRYFHALKEIIRAEKCLY